MSDRRDIREAMYNAKGRVAIMATTEVTQNIPEHSFLPAFWNTRARGLGGTPGQGFPAKHGIIFSSIFLTTFLQLENIL